MFDSVKIEMECPYCGEVSEMEAQTKELGCDLRVWREGDFVTDKLNYLDCVADCCQPKCKEYVTDDRGYFGGFGRMFNVKIMLDRGKVSGEYEIS